MISLSELFGVSLDELVYENTAQKYFLGIDGGGTKTAFKLEDEAGKVLKTVYKGACNPNDIGMEKAKQILKEGIQEICQGIPYSRIVMFAGIAGGGLTGDNDAVLKKFFEQFGFLAFGNDSDVDNLAAFSEYEDCILTIMGTGFIVFALHGGQKIRIAGWGQLFDQGGSGYNLGRDAIYAALQAADGMGEPTLLTELFEEQLGESAVDHLNIFYQEGKKYIASFSKLVFEAAEQGDKVANRILEDNAVFVARAIQTGCNAICKDKKDVEIPVLFAGGLNARSDVLFPLIRKNLGEQRCDLIQISKEPVDGALIMARKIYETRKK